MIPITVQSDRIWIAQRADQLKNSIAFQVKATTTLLKGGLRGWARAMGMNFVP